MPSSVAEGAEGAELRVYSSADSSAAVGHYGYAASAPSLIVPSRVGLGAAGLADVRGPRTAERPYSSENVLAAVHLVAEALAVLSYEVVAVVVPGIGNSYAELVSGDESDGTRRGPS